MSIFDVVLKVSAPHGEETHLLSETYSELPSLRETDKLSISFKSHFLGDHKVFLQDHPIDAHMTSRDGETAHFSSSFDYFLLNHFGVCSVAISSESSEEIYRFTPINVFATKINKDHAEKILVYLSSKIANVTNTCFTKTQTGSDNTHSSSADSLTKLEATRRLLDSIYAMRPRFISHPCRRSSEQLRVEKYNEGTHITEKEIAWLFQHLDHLHPTQADQSKVFINNRHYTIERIQRNASRIDTDVFENQVIFSFLVNAQEFLKSFPPPTNEGPIFGREGEYYSLDRLLERISLPLLERRYRESRAILHKCNELLNFFRKNVHCSFKGKLTPTLTAPAKRLIHYEKSFRLIDEWYKLGQPKWTGETYLFGLKSLDKLYELFCLYNLLDAMQDLGFKLERSEIRVPDRLFGTMGKQVHGAADHLCNYYQLKQGSTQLELLYEPCIWSFSEASMLGDLVDVFHSGRGPRSCWTPDFLVKLTRENTHEYFIFDAKYSNHSNTKERHLPLIIEKYYLKIRRLSFSGIPEPTSPIKCVYALIPKTITEHFGYQGGPVNIFDRFASPPFFGYTKLGVEERKRLLRLLSAAFGTKVEISQHALAPIARSAQAGVARV